MGFVPNSNGHHNVIRRAGKELQVECTKWLASKTGKLGYPLNHKHTTLDENFGFRSLIRRDAVVMNVLRHAVDATGARLFDFALAIFHNQSYCSAHDRCEESGIEKLLLENGTCFDLNSEKKNKITSASPVWCQNKLFLDEDGFLKEFDEIAEQSQDDLEGDYDPCCCYTGSLVPKGHCKAWEKQHGHGALGSTTTWCRSACIVFFRSACIAFFPTTTLGLDHTIGSLCCGANAADAGPKKKKVKQAKQCERKIFMPIRCRFQGMIASRGVRSRNCVSSVPWKSGTGDLFGGFHD